MLLQAPLRHEPTPLAHTRDACLPLANHAGCLPQVGLYATARIIAAVARAHMLPPVLARVHARLGTPWVATVLSGAATAVMALFTGVCLPGNDDRRARAAPTRPRCFFPVVAGSGPG